MLTDSSKFITEILILLFILVLSYEIIYWTGIYIGIWEYHAKDIFTEIPVHCAHLHIRLNISSQDRNKIKKYFEIRRKSKYNILAWNKVNKMKESLFEFKNPPVYYFEFGPEDFEMNKNPELGSTVEQLREKILRLFNESEIYSSYQQEKITSDNIFVFNNKLQEVTSQQDTKYLSQVHIETGDTIDCLVVYNPTESK